MATKPQAPRSLLQRSTILDTIWTSSPSRNRPNFALVIVKNPHVTPFSCVFHICRAQRHALKRRSSEPIFVLYFLILNHLNFWLIAKRRPFSAVSKPIVGSKEQILRQKALDEIYKIHKLLHGCES